MHAKLHTNAGIVRVKYQHRRIGAEGQNKRQDMAHWSCKGKRQGSKEEKSNNTGGSLESGQSVSRNIMVVTRNIPDVRRANEHFIL